MQWPSRAAYAVAVRGYPHISLLDPKLRGGKGKIGKDNFLLSYAGGFSIVFPIDMGSETFALRCWTQDVDNAQVRYQKISDYLEQKSLAWFIEFKYEPEGIMVMGKKYPVTRMAWVDGETLRDFIGKNLQIPNIFRTVADEFQKMVATLHDHQISHGDLQDGNILIKRNGAAIEIKLIDYDSLSVPALHGQTEQIVGLPEYQHPQRIAGGGKVSKKVDYFSELVIFLSFLSLSEKPDLWTQFGDEKRVDRGLLFSKKDFENPDQSDVFHELEKLSPDVQHLATTLKDFCAKTSIDQLAPLEAILPKPDANTYNNRGEVLLNNGRYNEALAEFRKAIAFDPNYEKARYGIGRVYLHSKRYADAINTFEQLIKGNPNYKEAHHGLSLAYFKSGDNNKATAAANAALRIDPYYQPARQLLDAIKSATPPPVPPKPPGPVPPPPDPTPNLVPNLWQHITGVVKHTTEVLKSNRHSVVQVLKNANQKLNRDNSELEDKLGNKMSATNMTSGDVVSLRRQLNERKKENRELQGQLIKKDTEIRHLRNDKAVALNENRKLKKQLVEGNQGTVDQTTTIRRLQKEKTESLNENRGLQKQLAEKTSEAKNLMARVQQLQNEKVETQRQNQKSQGENAGLIRQNRSLRNENTSLRDQLDKAKQGNAEGLIGPEPPKKIRIQNYRSVASRAASRNNQGCIEFERNNYDKAIKQFEQAIRADSEFAVAHYNLGCAYLEVKEYPKAISALGKAVAVNYKLKEAYYNLGITHLGKGAHKQAKSSIELALRIDKGYQRARTLLAAIEKTQR